MSTSAPSVPSNPTTPMSEFEFYFQFTKPLVLYLPSDDGKFTEIKGEHNEVVLSAH